MCGKNCSGCSQASFGAAPRIQDYSVPANSLVPHPCLTRAMHRIVTPGMVFDSLGCRLDPTTGWRIPEDCSGRNDPRTLCVGVELPVVSDVTERAASFAVTLAGFVGQNIPQLLGPLGSVLSGALVDLGSDLASALGDQLRAVYDRVKGIVDVVFAAVRNQVGGLMEWAEKQFALFTSAAKTITDILTRSVNGMLGAQLMAYGNVRANLETVSKLLTGNVPCANSLVGMVSSVGVSNLASVRSCLDSLKGVASLQAVTDVYRSTRGNLDPDGVRAFLGSMPDPTSAGASIGAIATRLSSAVGSNDPGISAALHLAETYTGKPDVLLAGLDIGQITDIVPTAQARRLFDKLSDTKSLLASISPVVATAEQNLVRAKEMSTAMLAHANDFEETAGKSVIQVQDIVRAKLSTTYAQADRSVNRAIRKARGTLDVTDARRLSRVL